jgi:carboxylesterase type B
VASSPVGLHYRSPQENAPFVKTVADAVGCSKSSNITQCLRSRPAEELKLADIAPEYIFHLFSPCKDCDNILPWLPVVDGDVLPSSPVEAFRLGTHTKVPTVISTTRNETLAFVPTILREAADSRVGYELAMKVLFRGRSEQVKQHYRASPDTSAIKDKALLVGFASTDALMTCYSRYVAKLLSKYAPTYLSTFMLAPHSSEMHADDICVAGPPNGATCHSADIAYFLPLSARMTSRTGVGYKNAEEAHLAAQYTATLINFTYGMDTAFVLYSNQSDSSTAWGISGHHESRYYHKDHCDFLESIGFVDAPWGQSPNDETAAVV